MRAEKKSILQEVRGKLSGSSFFFLANYTGLSVVKTDDLRRRLRGAKADFAVVPNKQFGMAAKECGYADLGASLSGPTALVYGKGDVVAAAKILKDFIKENDKKPSLKVGGLQGTLLSPADVENLAALPSREVLLGQVVGTIAAPMSRLVGVLQQKVASVVYVLKASADKKGSAA